MIMPSSTGLPAKRTLPRTGILPLPHPLRAKATAPAQTSRRHPVARSFTLVTTIVYLKRGRRGWLKRRPLYRGPRPARGLEIAAQGLPAFGRRQGPPGGQVDVVRDET